MSFNLGFRFVSFIVDFLNFDFLGFLMGFIY